MRSMAVRLIRKPRATHEDGRLYTAILGAGFSIGGFARRMGVVHSTVWRIDRGLIQPADEWYERAAALLGVPVIDLVPDDMVAA